MLTTYRIESGQLIPADTLSAQIYVYVHPDDAEKQDLLSAFGLDPSDLDAVYDTDEVPRLESGRPGTYIVWKHPDNVSCEGTVQFEVSSLGIAMGKNKVAVILPRNGIPVSGKEFKQIAAPEDFVLRLLLHTVHHYQGHLKAIKMMSQDLQTKIVTSMGNEYLLQMFELGESLVYYHNALEGNCTVLMKLRSAPERFGFSAEQVNFLDDVIIENQQASKQAAIYSTVLSGLMDARGNIINNNMNVLLKNLTIINVVFLPLNLIAGIGGMSEYSMMTQGVDWRVAYALFAAAMVAIGWFTWWWLVKVVERTKSRTIAASAARKKD